MEGRTTTTPTTTTTRRGCCVGGRAARGVARDEGARAVAVLGGRAVAMDSRGDDDEMRAMGMGGGEGARARPM